MARKGVDIEKGVVGANVGGDPFRICSLITTGIAVSGKLALGTKYILNSVDDCEALGLDETYDTANNVVVFEHVDEFFRMAETYFPAGQSPKLHLMVVAQTVTIAQMLDDTGMAYCRKMIVDAPNGEIHNMAIGFNPPVGYTETMTDGINAEVRAAISKAQAMYSWAAGVQRPLQLYIEGRAYGGNATTVIDLRAIPSGSDTLEADKVSVIIGQDYGFASTLTGFAQKHAAIGTFLGTMAACDLNQHPGEVDTFNLTDEKKGKWITAGLSSHVKTTDVEGTLDTLEEKAFIFADTYIGASGYRWNDDPTCTPVIVDADDNMNEHTISYGRTTDYTTRLLRKSLLKEVKKRKPTNPVTGLMLPGAIKDLDSKGNDVFTDMGAKGWLSGGKMTTDPNSDIIVAKTVNAGFYIVPYGNIGQINGKINLKVKA